MNRKRGFVKSGSKDYKLLWMAIPFITIVFLFSYVPIFGWIYSFFDYVPGVSIFECDFVGLEYFKLILKDDNVLRALKNTFVFAIINICLTPLPMLLAILLNELRNGPVKKFVQTFTTLPNFISWVIIFSLATALFASDGIITMLAVKLGLGDASNSLLGSNEAVYWFQSFLVQWKTLGWNSIIYMAAIAGIDQEQYEAAKVLGYTRAQTFFRIILPQVIKRIIPAMGNEVITLVKDTALVSVIGVAELLMVAKERQSALFSFAPLFIAGIFYFIMNWGVSIAFTRLEKKLDYYK